MVPAFSWTGFYVGVNGGYGSADGAADSAITGNVFGNFVGTGDGTLKGGLFGAQIGYNLQTGFFVFGVELDGQWANQTYDLTVDYSAFCGVSCSLTESATIDFIGTLRGRVGVAFSNVLLYGTGGLAYTSGEHSLTGQVAGAGFNVIDISHDATGYAAGVGIEVGFGAWSAKAEYLYVSTEFDANAPVPALFGGGTLTETVTLENHIVRGGLNYRFGW